MSREEAAKGDLAAASAAFFCYILANSIAYSIFGRLLGEGAAAQMLSAVAAMGAAFLVLGRDGSLPVMPKNALQPAAACLLMLALLAPVQLLNRAALWLLGVLGISSPAASLALPGDAMGVALVATKSVLLPAILEELLFRGVLLGRLRRHGRGFAAVASALFFTLLHSSLAGLPGIFLLAVVFALVDMRCGSLLPSMLMHGLNNLLAILFANLPGGAAEAAGFAALPLSAAAVLALLALRPRLNKLPAPPEKGEGLSPALIFKSLPAMTFAVFAGILILRLCTLEVQP